MKRILYITTYPVKESSDGISNKIKDQIKAMEMIGCIVDSIFRTEIGVQYNISNKIGHLNVNGKRKYLFFLYALKIIGENEEGYDYIYIRNPHGGLYSLFLYSMLKKIKKKGTVSILEIPHYPYENEGRSLMDKVANISHKISRKKFLPYIDRIVYMGPLQKNIWGKKSIRIVNAVDLEKNAPIKQNVILDNTIRFVGVAALAYWHGYDRLIKGIKEFTDENCSEFKVEFHIVGDGEPELTQLKSIVEKYNLGKYIFFHGRKMGEALNHIYDKMNVAVDSLGRHRSGNNYNCSIKSKEYTARNLPFIKSHLDDSFNCAGFVFNAPADDSAINLNEVVEWYQSLGEYGLSIRNYAIKNFSMETQVKHSLGIIDE